MAADEDTFLEQIAASDSDDTRLVFADWLEERGDIRAEYLRLEVRLHHLESQGRSAAQDADRRRFVELAKRIDPTWRRQVDRVLGLGRPAPAPRPPEPRRVRTDPGPGDLRSALMQYEAPQPRTRIAERVGASLGLWVFALLLLAAAVGATGCSFATHIQCHGGREGVCSLDTYGLFTAVGHVDIPVREIVEISVDEKTPRRGPSTARVAIVTRSRGRIDLSGGQLLGSSFPTSDAVEASAALRQLVSTKSSPPKDVDLWVGSSRLGVVITLAFALLLWWLFAMTVRSIFRDAA